MGNSAKIIKLALLLLILIILGGAVYVLSGKMGSTSLLDRGSVRTYTRQDLGWSLNYPSQFVVLEERVGPEKKESIITFAHNDESIRISSMVISEIDAQISMQVNDAILKNEPNGSLKNASVSVGGFEGFKSLIDFTRSKYVLFKPLTSTTTLAMDVYTTSATSEGLLELEEKLRAMLSTATSTQN